MADKDIALMAHLMRRAGFGAPYEELEALEAVVMPMGMLAMCRGLQAWATEVGAEPA